MSLPDDTPVKIYALINPLDKKVFYVGATRSELKVRLSNHLATIRYTYASHCKTNERNDLISQILESGLRPIIELLNTVNLSECDFYEAMYYNMFTISGCRLLQSATAFNYQTATNTYYG